MTEWQPIKTAPRDGTHIIGRGPSVYSDGTVTIGEIWWEIDRWSQWETVDAKTKKLVDYEKGHWQGVDIIPEYWMPIPPLTAGQRPDEAR